jgi:DNA ligase D-like protein (predicted ligase)
MAGPLPEFIAPMLAKIGREPFDSDKHLFEIKWDGTRALAFVEGGGYRLRNRRKRDIEPTYPELAFLAGIEPGAVLDGEICVLRDGRPDFSGMLEREQARTATRGRELARALPATYIVFDLLYRAHDPVMAQPLLERREQLREIVAACGDPRLLFSDGVLGAGVQLFEQLRAQELEGMIAKRIDSRYRPGERTDAWLKIKPAKRLHCAIVGYQAPGDDLRSLIIAAPDDIGQLQCVGRVGSGLRRKEAAELLALLRKRARATPLIECGMPGEWVEPGLYCVVSFFERSATGLRGPVFEGLIEEP